MTWAALALGAVCAAAVPAVAQSSEVCFDVELRGGTSEICADVHSNPAAPLGVTILAIHGFTETAATFKPLAQALFTDRLMRFVVKRVIAIDLPGHGDSEAPIGLPAGLFGTLTLQDNVSVVIQSIDTLRAKGLGARVILGHSMGGLAVQGTQEALLTQGSSLAAKGVLRAILLAPVPALEVTWTQPPPSELGAFVVSDEPALGPYLDLPPEIALVGGGFTTTAGTIVSGAPTPAEMADYVGWEPLTTTLQLVGQAQGLPRLSAREGAFALWRGTVLSVVGFSEDVLTPAADLDDLYRHLIGRPGLLYREIDEPEAVHGMFISDPQAVVDVLKTLPF